MVVMAKIRRRAEKTRDSKKSKNTRSHLYTVEARRHRWLGEGRMLKHWSCKVGSPAG